MKKIQYILLAFALILPASVSAATFSIIPKVGTIPLGSTVVSSVYVNPGVGETLTATKVSLVFPTNIIDALSYTPVSGGNILVHIGTKVNNTSGTIIDNIAFNPGITSKTKIATIVFKAKKSGVANVVFSADSKLLDSTNTNKEVGSTGASFTITTPIVTAKKVVKQKKTVAKTKPKLTKVKTFTKTVVPVVVSSTTNGSTTKEGTTTTNQTATNTNLQLAAAVKANSGNTDTIWYYLLAVVLLLIGATAVWKKWGYKIKSKKNLM